jgi:hypothetical protein
VLAKSGNVAKSGITTFSRNPDDATRAVHLRAEPNLHYRGRDPPPQCIGRPLPLAFIVTISIPPQAPAGELFAIYAPRPPSPSPQLVDRRRAIVDADFVSTSRVMHRPRQYFPAWRRMIWKDSGPGWISCLVHAHDERTGRGWDALSGTAEDVSKARVFRFAHGQPQMALQRCFTKKACSSSMSD